jgi:hypothetical protein
MSRTQSLGLGALGGLVFVLALLLALAVPEEAFADAGSDCNTLCQTGCAADCNGDQACMSICLGYCGSDCCGSQCQNNPTCRTACCQAVCGSDQACMASCLAPAPFPRKCRPSFCTTREKCKSGIAGICNAGGFECKGSIDCSSCSCQNQGANCDCKETPDE